MKYIRRHNLNLNSLLDDTILQRADGNIELNPTQKVIINGELEFPQGAAIPGPEVTNVMYVTLDGDDDNSGFGEGPSQAKRTIKAAVEAAQEGTTIYVRSGEYYEDNPIRIPPKVSIVGDNLRRVILRPLNGPLEFEIVNVERTAQVVTITTTSDHSLQKRDRVRIRCSNDAVDETDVNILDVPSSTTFTYRQSGTNISPQAATGRVLHGRDYFLVNSQNYIIGMVFKGLRAPAYCVNIDTDAIVDTSPYVQNCSNINGPWMRNGVEWLPFQTEQPDINSNFVTGPRPLLDNEIDPLQVDTYGIDIEGAGGGMLIDGDRYNSQSPIKSMVADAFTQVAQGAVGFHITNFGYMQLVSCFAVFCSKSFYTTRGGYLSISNSVCDFGNSGFEADGYYLDPYAQGLITSDYYSTVASTTVVTPGSGFAVAPTITIDPPTVFGGTQAQAVASIDPILGTLNAITIIDPGYGYDFQPAITITPANGATAIANLAKNLTIDVSELANKPQVGSIMFLGNDPTAYYVSSTTGSTLTFRYDELKCRRDVGLILDAVLTDMIFNSNQQSVFAGLAYLRSYSSKVTSLQKTQTIDGLNEARDLALALTSDPTATTRITDNFNTVTNIINLGLAVVPSLSTPTPAGADAGYAEAAAILIANKLFIQDEIVAWLDQNYPTFTYDTVKCSRDVGLILNAVVDDLVFGSNYRSITAGLSYIRSYSSTVTEQQRSQTIDGIVKARDLALQFVFDYEIRQQIIENFKIITDIIDDADDSSVPLSVFTNAISVGSGYTNAARVLQANRNFLKAEIIAWIGTQVQGNIPPFTNSFIYSKEKCSRDVGYIIDALTYDMLYGGNSQTILAGNSYYYGVVSVIPGQEAQSVAAFTRLQTIISTVIQSISITPSSGNIVPQIISLPGGSIAAGSDLVDLINVLNDIVLDGTTATVSVDPTYANAFYFTERNTSRLAVLAQELTIRGNVISYLDDKYATPYNESKCRRDIGYIIDSMAYDLIYEGNTQTINAGLSYAEGSVLKDEIEETKAAYEYWKSITKDIVENISITPTPGNLTAQNTSLPLGSPLDTDGPANKAEDLLQIIIDVIDHGTGYVPDPIFYPNYSLGNVSLITERDTILASSAAIQDDVIDYLNTTYGGSVTVTTFPSVESVVTGTEALFHNVSTISTGGTALEYVGAGVTYNALPFFGGEPDPTKERVEINNGKCFTVSNDQVGNFRIGQFFTVNAITGEVTIDAENLNLSGLSAIGPFKRNGTFVGVQLREVSNNPNLIASTGFADINTVPTQPAVQTYVENRYLNKVQSGTPQTVESDVAFKKDVEIRGGDLTTDQTTFNLIDATATTVNFAGAATTLDVGAATGTLTVNNQTITFLNATTINVNGSNPTIASTSIGTLSLFNNNISTVNAFGEATAINFGEISGTTTIKSLNTVLDGDLQVKGGDITTNQTTFNLINATATTVNFAGAATDLNIGAGSGTTTVANNFEVNLNTTLGFDTTSESTIKGKVTVSLRDNTAGVFDIKEDVNSYIKIDTDNSLELITFGTTPKLKFLNTTDASNTTTAAATFAGGVGIAKKLYVGENLYVNGNATLGDDRLFDVHAINGTLTVDVPDNTAIAAQIKENTQTYLTVVTTNGSESVTFEATPKVLIKNTTDSTDKDTGALIVEGGVGIEKNLSVGVAATIGQNTTIGGDLAVNGGDITTTAATFNLVDATATTVNFAGAATAIDIGASTGTLTINNKQTVFNSTDSIQIPAGTTAERDVTPVAGQIRYNSQLSTFEGYGPGSQWGSLGGVKDIDGNTYIIPETAPGANENILYFYNNSELTLTISETTADFKSGIDVLISSSTASTNKTSGALVVTGGVGVGGTVSANELTLTTDLAVQYGGTGQSNFTTNGVIYGNNTSGLLVTAASNPGSNATTSYGILTTDGSNVPTWTDVIDGGSY